MLIETPLCALTVIAIVASADFEESATAFALTVSCMPVLVTGAV
jgi:hypothetical protein